MLHIYSPHISPRLLYTLKVCFQTLVHIKFELTDDHEKFNLADGPKLNYSTDALPDALHVHPAGLLEETSIEVQAVNFKTLSHLPVIFGNETAFEFDPLAAIFYVITRYEEYLPHEKDPLGRFRLKDSLQYQHNFYEKAIVHHWLEHLLDQLMGNFPNLEIERNKYSFRTTIDIDNAYAYKHKNAAVTLGGWIKDLFTKPDNLLRRTLVLLNQKKDPYDNYQYLSEQITKHAVPTTFFLLTSDRGPYDKNISPEKPAFKDLVKKLQGIGEVGIHPSFQSNGSLDTLNTEINVLSKITTTLIADSRQHFLKIQFPDTFERLIQAKIQHDYSLGFSEAIGFRSGCAIPHPFFNLKANEETKLILHPFFYMDATFLFHQKNSFQEIQAKLKVVMDEVKKFQGRFIPVWHNECFGSANEQEWKKLFEWMLEYGQNK